MSVFFYFLYLMIELPEGI